jgi:adenine-specific DNA glycosylase
MPARDLQVLADAVVPPARPADWTAALMDIGATLCRPLRPECAACPLAVECRYAAARMDTATAHPRLPPAAAPVPADRRAAERAASYETTTRWLRGRIMARLSAADDAWLTFEAPLGAHGPEAVEAALEELRRDGLAQTDGAGRWRLPTD